MVNKNYLLLDNQSTAHQIANPSLLKIIRKSSKPININCNAGVSKTELEGELGQLTVHHNPNSIDNQSTVHQIANPNLLKNIRKSSKPINIHCNSGVSKTELDGELGQLTVHHNPNSIANVLSLKAVAEKHRITYNSWDRNGVFKVHTPNRVVEFKPSKC
jgi:hypothetical protein